MSIFLWMLPECPRKILLLVKEDYDDVLYKVIEDKDGSAPNHGENGEFNFSHITPFRRISRWTAEICTTGTPTIATTFCCYSPSHFYLTRIIPSWTSTSSQHRSSPSQRSIVVRTLTRTPFHSSISDSTTSEQNFLKFVEILFYSFFLSFFFKPFAMAQTRFPLRYVGLSSCFRREAGSSGQRLRDQENSSWMKICI